MTTTSNFSNLLQSLPPIVNLLVSILLFILAISWLVLPWTIRAKLSSILRVQERQLAELERISHRD